MMNNKRSFRKHKAFTLVEIVVALSASIVLFVWLPYMAFACFTIMQKAEEGLYARERIDSVLSVISYPAVMCGYGIPSGGEDMRAVFGTTSQAPLSWESALVISDVELPNTREAAVCRMLYAIPADVPAIKALETTVTSNDVFDIRVARRPDLIETSPSPWYSTKNWVIFGTNGDCPAEAIAISSLSDGSAVITLKKKDSSRTAAVYANDELMCLRSITISVLQSDGADISESSLRTDDHLGNGLQPRVDGVIDVRFAFEEERDELTVWVLARGNRRFDSIVTKGTPDGWPDKWADDIPESARHYVLAAARTTFCLKNLSKR